MRKNPAALLLTCLLLSLLLLPSCEEAEPVPAGSVGLYYLSGEDGGPALVQEFWDPGSSEVTPESVLQALLNGPYQDEHASPFPRGTALVSCSPDPGDPGCLKIQLTEQYGGLTDVALTLADYSIVLTLGQLEGVTSVEISASGLPSAYRSHQILAPDEAVLEELPLS